MVYCIIVTIQRYTTTLFIHLGIEKLSSGEKYVHFTVIIYLFMLHSITYVMHVSKYMQLNKLEQIVQ